MIRLQDWWDQGALVEVDGHRYFSRVQGQGPTLVFLHGFPTSSHDWSAVIDDLRNDFRCVTFDYLGYGASDKPATADYSSLEQTARALAVLRHLDVESATVVAHDLGGILLQQIVHQLGAGGEGISIEQAVFVNSSVYAQLYRPTANQLALIDPTYGEQVAARLDRQTIGASMAGLFPKYPPPRPIIDDFAQAIVTGEGQRLWPRHLVYMTQRAALGASWMDSLRKTSIPLAFVYGLADPISGEHILAHARADLPRAHCIGLPGLGHYPHVESPEEFGAALRLALQRLSGQGSQI